MTPCSLNFLTACAELLFGGFVSFDGPIVLSSAVLALGTTWWSTPKLNNELIQHQIPTSVFSREKGVHCDIKENDMEVALGQTRIGMEVSA
jgi:hypothetical protein